MSRGCQALADGKNCKPCDLKPPTHLLSDSAVCKTNVFHFFCFSASEKPHLLVVYRVSSYPNQSVLLISSRWPQIKVREMVAPLVTTQWRHKVEQSGKTLRWCQWVIQAHDTSKACKCWDGVHNDVMGVRELEGVATPSWCSYKSLVHRLIRRGPPQWAYVRRGSPSPSMVWHQEGIPLPLYGMTSEGETLPNGLTSRGDNPSPLHGMTLGGDTLLWWEHKIFCWAKLYSDISVIDLWKNAPSQDSWTLDWLIWSMLRTL